MSLRSVTALILGGVLVPTLPGQVATDTAPSAAELQTRFLRKHCHPIRIEDASGFADLKCLREPLRHKRIVLLGESNHGSREFNLLKNRLIRFLHEEMGYRVLLLESGMGEVYSIHHFREQLSERQMLSAGLVGPWRSREFLELMAYVKKKPELYVGGYDVQRSGRSFAKVLDKAVGALGEGGTSAEPLNVEQRFSTVVARLTNRRRKLEPESVKEVGRLRAAYADVRQRILDGKPTLRRRGWKDDQVVIVAETLRNRIAYLDYYLQFRRDNDYRKRFGARDAAMAQNVLLFAKQLFPKEKIIISGHNFHVAKHNAKEKVMGEVLAKPLAESMYSIGFFAGAGTFANNSRKPEKMAAPVTDDDIQRVIGRVGLPAAFLAVPSKPSPGGEWLFRAITANHTFLDLEGGKKLIISNTFDALILVARISVAKY